MARRCPFRRQEAVRLAQWFQDRRIWPVHELPGESLSGLAWRNQQTITFADIASDPRLEVEPFLRQSAVRSICVSPLRFADGATGALALYRRSAVSFSAEELSQVEVVASALPLFYQAIHDRLSVDLISDVDDLLTFADASDGHLTESGAPRQQLETVCAALSRTFGCGRVSLLLRESPAERDLGVWFTAGAPPLPSDSLSSDGISDWVLSNRRAIRLMDVRQESVRIGFPDGMYPGLTLSETAFDEDERALASSEYGHSIAGHPISFMAVPIVIRGVPFGLLRCVGSIRGPDYFALRDLHLLESVASRLSHFWSNFLGHRELLAENRFWQMLIESLDQLDSHAQKRLYRSESAEVETLQACLHVIAHAMQGADQLAVRLLGQDRRELHFVASAGDGWYRNEIGSEQVRFSMESQELAKEVLRLRRARLLTIKDGSQLPRPYDSAKLLLTVPIMSAHEQYGVLDIASSQSEVLPPHAESIAELLGRQLGLYHFLGTTLAQLRGKENELHDFVRHQHWTYQDFEHQLRSPVLQAHRRVDTLLQRHQLGDGALAPELFRIRGLLAKANRVAMNTRLFASLATGTAITPALEKLEMSEMVRLLIEAASDAQCLVDPRRHVRFVVDQSSKTTRDAGYLEIDRGLLLMAVSNLLDNAAKYSYQDSTVTIKYGVDKKDVLSIAVSNCGLRLTPDEVSHVSTRGYRGNAAVSVIGEGSGIGLWIVDNVMKAHRGELSIVPTSKDGVTVVRLRFPPPRTR